MPTTRLLPRWHHLHHIALLLGVLVGLGETAVAGPNEGASAQLDQLFEQAWEADLRHHPVRASNLGDKRYNTQWADLSLPALAAQHTHNQKVLEALREIGRDALPPPQQLNYDLFEREYIRRLERYPLDLHLIPMNQRGGVQTADELLERLRFEQAQDYRDWIARLEAMGTRIDQTIALMRTGITRGQVPPEVVFKRIPAQIAAQIVSAPDASPFYKPFKEFAVALPAQEQTRLRTRAKQAISTVVVPAYQRLAQFVDEHYLPACRRSVGLSDTPGGRTAYETLTRHFTTTQLHPDDIHQIGLDEVARIRAQMRQIIEQLAFDGDFAQFLQFLRTDPQFYFDNPEDLLTAYRATAKRIDPALVELFARLPRTPYGVRPIPANIAPDTTTAYYMRPAADGTRPGYYYVNLHLPEVRPKYEIEVLTVHEAMPGHHLQIALSQELGELPAFRRYLGFTAFVEGWALYSESLGEALGLYRDPYSKFGQLTYEMWRAVRLVVDTGLHYKNWTRQRAIDYFAANTAKTQHDIVNEIDRYIAWPGQALAYKIGELKIKELRARAQSTLGQHFDVRMFHEAVLGAGAIPLDVLEANVDHWIHTQQQEHLMKAERAHGRDGE